MKRFVSAAVLSLATLSAAAVPVTFSVNQSITQGRDWEDSTNYDDDGGDPRDHARADVSLPFGAILQLDPGTSSSFLDLGISGGRFGVSGDYNSLQQFAAGATISASTLGAPTLSPDEHFFYAMYEGIVDSAWNRSFNNKYLGFVTGNGNFGYVSANWTFDAGTGVGTLFLGQGAIESVAGQALTIAAAGEVPEPGSLALLGLGLGLAGIATRRRQKSR